MSNQPLVEVENLNVDFPLGRSLLGKPPMLRAVNDVSLKIMPQTFFGLVGESGSGKTTLGRAMLRAAPITSGTISFNHGNTKYDVGAMSKMELKEYRKKAQLIFQDPYAALNPRMTVRDIIAEPLEVMELVQTREEADQKVREIASNAGSTLSIFGVFRMLFQEDSDKGSRLPERWSAVPISWLQMKAWPLLMFPSRQTSSTCSSPSRTISG